MARTAGCPACEADFGPDGWDDLASHLVARAGASDASHVMWLNRRVTKHRRAADELSGMVRAVLEGSEAPPGAPRVAR